MSPVRIEIAEMLRCLGPSTVAELARSLDRPADTLYRHLDLLEQAGFVVTVETRKRGRHMHRVLDLTADDFAAEFLSADGAAQNDAIVTMAESATRAAFVAVRDSAATGRLKFDAQSTNLAVRYELGWLTAERFAEARSLVMRLKEIMDEGKRSREGSLYLAVAVVAPVTRKNKPRRRGGGSQFDRGSSRNTAMDKAVLPTTIADAS